MRRFIALLVAFISVFLLNATAKSAERIVLIGDSEAYLLSWEFPRLARAGGHQFHAVVVPGSSVIQWSEHLGDEWGKVFRFKPSLVLVSLGANDAYMGRAVVSREPPFLGKILRRLRRTSAKRIVWIGPPDLPLRRDGLMAFVDMIKRTDVEYLDSREIRVTMWPDLLHPDIPGRRVWAEWIWGRLWESSDGDGG